MPETIRSQYKEQLPKRPIITLRKMVAGAGTISSILGIVYIFIADILAINPDLFLYFLSIILLNICLIIYIILQEKNRLKYYAEFTIYNHYINHIVRDYLSDIKSGYKRPLSELLSEIVNTIAECYTVIIGRKCRATIKELKPDLSIITTVRDDISLSKIQERSGNKIHKLDDNTDFYNLWYSIEGCSRFFICDNLPKRWKLHRYKNSSFEIYGELPKVIFLNRVINWDLPYKSTIVWPIRYIANFSPPEKDTEKEQNPDWKFWGFLCIDSYSTNIFNKNYIPEIGAAFADLLYLFFNELNKTNKKKY